MRLGRVDLNQAVIVTGLRAVGASVQSLASIGKGCPDLLVGHRGVNYLFEIKNPEASPSARVLTPMEKLWHLQWKGDVVVVHTLGEALVAMGLG